MTHRRLRPWAVMTVSVFLGVTCALLLIIFFCYTIEALTGFNPLWLTGSM